jgi:hypothetical protein
VAPSSEERRTEEKKTEATALIITVSSEKHRIVSWRKWNNWSLARLPNIESAEGSYSRSNQRNDCVSRWNTHIGLLVAAVAACTLIGCESKNQPAPTVTSGETAGHEHDAEGPHHGHLIELGAGDYHAELAHDDATKTLTIYLLGKDAKTPVTIPDPELTLNLVVADEPIQVKLPAARQDSDPEGKSSRFSVMDEQAVEAHDADKTTGRLTVTIDGKDYPGKFENLGHGHAHDHK